MSQRSLRKLTRSIKFSLILILAALPSMAEPDVADTRRRASELLQQKDWPAAAAAYREVVEAEPGDAWSWYILGNVLQGLQDHEGAIRALEASLEHGLSTAGLARYDLACLHAGQGRKEKAFELLEPAAQSGLFDAAKLDSDPDLASLRGDERFAKLRHEADLAARPCEVLEEYKTMDFLIGTWDVYLAGGGPKAATNTFEKSTRGCVIRELWSSTLGGGFETFSHYDAVRGSWYQKMAGSVGGNVAYEGRWHDGALRLEGDTVGRVAPVTRSRRTWTPLGDGRVRMTFENSTDGGKSWALGFQGVYVRRTDR